MYKFQIKKSKTAMHRLSILSDDKPVYSEFFVSIDMTNWLGSEDIDSITFTAKNFETKQNATSAVIDTTKCTNTTKVLKPFIKAGTDEEFYLLWAVSDKIK